MDDTAGTSPAEFDEEPLQLPHRGAPTTPARTYWARKAITTRLAPITRPLARLGLRKSATDRAAEPPFSPWAPINLDDDVEVTQVLQLALDIASVLLSSGEGAADTALQAEAVASAYGLPHATCEVTFTSLQMGVSRRPGRPPITVLKVIEYRTVDMTRMMRITRIIDQILRRRITPAQAAEEVDTINSAAHPFGFNMAILGWSSLAAGVVIQLGGSPVAALIAAVSIFITMWINRTLSNAGLPVFFQQCVGGFIAAFTTLAAYAAFQNIDSITINPSQVVAAGIIVLLAGLTLVGAIEDAITGYAVTAAGRAVETLMLTGGIAGGIATAIAVWRRFGVTPPPIDPRIYGTNPTVVVLIAAGVGAAGFAIASYASWSAALLGGTVGLTSMAIYQACIDSQLGAIVGSGAAAVMAGFLSGILARWATMPPLVVTLAGITPLLPGLSLYRGIAGLTSDDPSGSLNLVFQTISIAVALAAGVIFGEWLTRVLRRSSAAET